MNKFTPLIMIVLVIWLFTLGFTLFFTPPTNEQKTDINYYLQLSYNAPIFTATQGTQAINGYLNFIESKKDAQQFAVEFIQLLDRLDINFPPKQRDIKVPSAYAAQHEIIDRFTPFNLNETSYYPKSQSDEFYQHFLPFLLKYHDLERAEKILSLLAKQKYKNLNIFSPSIALIYAKHGHCQKALQWIAPIFSENILHIRTFRDESDINKNNREIVLDVFFTKLLCENSESALEFLITYEYSLINFYKAYVELLQRFAIILYSQENINLSLNVLEEANNFYDNNVAKKYARPVTYEAYLFINQEEELSQIIKKRSQNPNYESDNISEYYLLEDYNSFINRIAFLHDRFIKSKKRITDVDYYFLSKHINHPDFKTSIEILLNTSVIEREYGFNLVKLLELYIDSHDDNEVRDFIKNTAPSFYGINPDTVIPALINKKKFVLLEEFIENNSALMKSDFHGNFSNGKISMTALDTLNYVGNINKLKLGIKTQELSKKAHEKTNIESIIMYLLQFGYKDLAIELQMKHYRQSAPFWIEILEQNMAKLEPQVNFEAELTEEAFLRQFSDYE
jgi:predicted RNA-binding protein Jag